MTQPNVYWTLLHAWVTIIGLYTNVPEGGAIAEDQLGWPTTERRAARPRRNADPGDAPPDLLDRFGPRLTPRAWRATRPLLRPITPRRARRFNLNDCAVMTDSRGPTRRCSFRGIRARFTSAPQRSANVVVHYERCNYLNAQPERRSRRANARAASACAPPSAMRARHGAYAPPVKIAGHGWRPVQPPRPAPPVPLARALH